MTGTWGIVLAAGRGERFGQPKQFLRVGTEMLVERAVATLREVCDGVVAVAVPGTGPIAGADATVDGGAVRAASVRAGLAAVPATADVIVVHDAAHPLATAALVRRVVGAVEAGADGAVPVVTVTETLARVDGTRLGDIVPKAVVVLVQMPHAFRAGVLRTAHAGDPDVSDEATLLRAHGHTVVAVPGEAANVHVTTPDELEFISVIARSLFT
jgi:2-C-methyl-D-erythritol 4-phosphate cytidylyltransferase